MPSFTTTIEADVPINGTLSIVVPGLRQGDIHPGTGRMTIDQTQVPAEEVDFMATFGTEPMLNAYNRGTEVWPQGSEAVLAWDGEIIEQQVADLDARVTVLENLNEWFTSGELTAGSFQLKTGPGMVGRVIIQPMVIEGMEDPDPLAAKPSIFLSVIDGVGNAPPAYPIFQIDTATVLTTTSELFEVMFPFQHGLYIEVPSTERCVISWR